MSAMPNAGVPMRVEGRNIYLCSPEYMAQYARRLLWAGVKIIGGCCGTTPEHIKLIRSETRSLQPAQKKPGGHGGGAARQGARPAAGAAWRRNPSWAPSWPRASSSRSWRFCRRAAWTPRARSPAPSCAPSTASTAINVPDGPRASARMSAQVTCQLIQQQAGIEAVNHFCCRDRNILGIQSELLGAHTAGVRNLICITGDPPRMGAYPDATAVFDVDAIGLVNIVNNLNHGLDIGGNPMGSQTAMVIGVGANPGALNLDEEIRRFEWKVEAGAEYVVTQPVFDLNLLETFLQPHRARQDPGDLRHLAAHQLPQRRIHGERTARAGSRTSTWSACAAWIAPKRPARKASRSRAKWWARVRGMVEGVQLSAPFGRYQMALDVAEALGRPLTTDGPKNCNMATDLVEIDPEAPQPEDAGARRRHRAPRQGGGHPHRRPVHCWWPIRSTCARSRRFSRRRAASRTVRCPF